MAVLVCRPGGIQAPKNSDLRLAFWWCSQVGPQKNWLPHFNWTQRCVTMPECLKSTHTMLWDERRWAAPSAAEQTAASTIQPTAICDSFQHQWACPPPKPPPPPTCCHTRVHLEVLAAHAEHLSWTVVMFYLCVIPVFFASFIYLF